MPVVEVRALGRKKWLLDDFSVPLPPGEGGDGGRTLRDVITGVVAGEVAAFRERQEAGRFLKALSPAEIDAAAETGKVISGDRDIAPQAVDEGEAVANALTAFEDGIYMVVIDGARVTGLDDEVRLADDSRITFLRLTLLAGG